MTDAIAVEQPSLPGISQRVQTPAPRPDVLLRIAIAGQLAGHPLIHATTDGQTIVEVLLQQHLAEHPGVMPLLAVLREDMGVPLTHQAAVELAARLAVARDVLVIGRGLEPRRHHGREVLRFIHCDRIAPAPEGAFHG